MAAGRCAERIVGSELACLPVCGIVRPVHGASAALEISMPFIGMLLSSTQVDIRGASLIVGRTLLEQAFGSIGDCATGIEADAPR